MVNAFAASGLVLRFSPSFARTETTVRGTACQDDGSAVNIDMQVQSFYSSNPVPSYGEVRATFEALKWSDLLPQIRALGGGYERATALAFLFA